MKKLNGFIFTVVGWLVFNTGFAQNPNFHIYICFGQSNMEGQGAIEAQDKEVDSRFKVLQSLDCDGRNKNEWHTAVPPLCQCGSGLSPADYFGRTMVKHLPDSITVGVINVAVGGSDIRLFDKDLYQKYDSTYKEEWFLSKIKAYEGNPRKHLMDLAKLAQQEGVIKGILIHQGEANSGDSEWPSYVKKIYTEMLSELSLNPDTVPLLTGEVLSEQGSCCGKWMNPIINKLPMTIPTAHVISANELTGKDAAHFDEPSYRKLGMRYAEKMLSLMGIEAKVFEPKCSE
ncbi:MAG: sialate O-acetylesterase [Flavobacterium sp.]|uniref:sialate O-acetylesterase n=1 Tax=Flavobacterium sp. TaxID=239 RepID=UPI002631B7EF|nr:sialate O-acetylesterase [Flavobacterium sp.]MDD5149821.1 sialate O-acetylesterase [Flavobacterium sp.]